MKTPGVDTIKGLVGTLPKTIAMDYDTVKAGEMVRQLWNKSYMAFIPYCFACKEPLVWHIPPDKDHVLFHCPKCKRKWKMNKGWVAKLKEEPNGKAVCCGLSDKR